MSEAATSAAILADEWKSRAQSALERIYETLDRNKKALEESILLRKRVENIHTENRILPISPTNPFSPSDDLYQITDSSAIEPAFIFPEFQSPEPNFELPGLYAKFRKSQKDLISPTSVVSEDKFQEMYEKYKNEEYLKIQYENHARELNDRVRELELKVSMIRKEVQKNGMNSPEKQQIKEVQKHLEIEQKQIKELEELFETDQGALEMTDSFFSYSKTGEFGTGKLRPPRLNLDKIGESNYYDSYRDPPLNREDLVKPENEKMKNILDPIKEKLQALESNYKQKLQHLEEQLHVKIEENTELKKKLEIYESSQDSFNARLTHLLSKINEQKDQNEQLKEQLKHIYDQSERPCSCASKDAIITKMREELESYMDKIKELEYIVSTKRYTEMTNYISTTENTESTNRTKLVSPSYRSLTPLRNFNLIPSTDISVLVSKKKKKAKKKTIKPKKKGIIDNKENKDTARTRRKSAHK
jgi:hypothetical protein